MEILIYLKNKKTIREIRKSKNKLAKITIKAVQTIAEKNNISLDRIESIRTITNDRNAFQIFVFEKTYKIDQDKLNLVKNKSAITGLEILDQPFMQKPYHISDCISPRLKINKKMYDMIQREKAELQKEYIIKNAKNKSLLKLGETIDTFYNLNDAIEEYYKNYKENKNIGILENIYYCENNKRIKLD